MSARSLTAMRARESALAVRHGGAADADRVLAEALADVHLAMREGARRLDAIADEIDSAVSHQSELAVDTPMGVREFQRFLLTKQREITAVVTDARELSHAKRAVLEGLRGQYAGSADS